MNVGILSMQRIQNWGSFLQALALKKTVEELGHECSFLDIKKGVGLTEQEVLAAKGKCKIGISRRVSDLISCCLDGKLLVYLKSKIHSRKFKKIYNQEYLPILGIDKYRYESDKSFDLVIIGSDEVFNCAQPRAAWGKTLHLFGKGINAKRIITYAASFGYTTMDDLERLELKERIIKALGKISTFSVRDMNSYSIIEQLTGRRPELCVDPTMMFDFSSYMPSKVPIKNYLIVYTYQGRIADPEIIKAIKDFAVSKDKTIISLSGYCDWCDQCIIADTPFELLSYFANADYVITDTFHGTVFSIKYNRNFCTIVRDTNTQKLTSLLSQFKLANRIVKVPTDIKCKLEEGIDYTETNTILDEESKKAKAYLKEAIHL